MGEVFEVVGALSIAEAAHQGEFMVMTLLFGREAYCRGAVCVNSASTVL